jgi:hypothetical protein
MKQPADVFSEVACREKCPREAGVLSYSKSAMSQIQVARTIAESSRRPQLPRSGIGFGFLSHLPVLALTILRQNFNHSKALDGRLLKLNPPRSWVAFFSFQRLLTVLPRAQSGGQS